MGHYVALIAKFSAALVDTDTTALNELLSVQDGTCLSNVETTTREPEEVLRKISIRAG